jgi:hypothetical protein
MRAGLAILLAGFCALAGCKQDIPPPAPDPEDAGGPVDPSDVPSFDAQPIVDEAVLPPDVAPPPTCGASGLSCCPGNVCLGGGCCQGGKCVANGTACRADATCLNGSCGGCGALVQGMPQPCCDMRACTASRTTCLGDAVGLCQACGGRSQSCCGDGFCDTGLTCNRALSPAICAPK